MKISECLPTRKLTCRHLNLLNLPIKIIKKQKNRIFYHFYAIFMSNLLNYLFVFINFLF